MRRPRIQGLGIIKLVHQILYKKRLLSRGDGGERPRLHRPANERNLHMDVRHIQRSRPGRQYDEIRRPICPLRRICPHIWWQIIRPQVTMLETLRTLHQGELEENTRRRIR